MDNEVRSLTGLRGVAAAAVVLYHLVEMLHVPMGPLRLVALRGYLAVDVFFVLSGFVMALRYAPRFARGFDADAYRDFLLRRVARIYPLYAVVLAAMVLGVACGAFPGWDLRQQGATILANVLLVQGWSVGVSLNGPAWSISTEAAAYLLFPALLGVTVFGGWRRAVGTAVIACVLLGLAVAAGPRLQPSGSGALDLYRETTPLPLIRCLVGFSFGLLVYRVTQVPSVARLAMADGTVTAVMALLAIGLWHGVDDRVIYPLLPLLVLCLAANRGRAARLFGSGVAHWLGVLSYAIYLLHEGVFWGAQQMGLAGGWLGANVALVLLFGLAVLAHHAIELPGRRLIRGWGRGVAHTDAELSSTPRRARLGDAIANDR